MSLDYVARCRTCGGLSFWISAECPAAHIAKEVASVIRSGRQVELMDTEATRRDKWCLGGCCGTARQQEMAL